MLFKRNREKLLIGTLGAAIGAGAPAAKIEGQVADDHTQPAEAVVYGDAYSLSSFESSIPDAAVAEMLQALDATGSDPLAVTQEQITAMHEAVDSYIANHPAVQGEVTTSTDENGGSSSQTASFDPYYAITDAILRGPNLRNVALMGATIAYVKELQQAK